VALAHHTLLAWQRADDLFLKLHQLSLKAFPAFEKFELGGQLDYIDEKTSQELDLEVRQVWAPLAGLIASERLKSKTEAAGVIVFVLL
jgi:hypothetical protein